MLTYNINNIAKIYSNLFNIRGQSMGNSIPKEVYVYVISWLNNPSQLISTLPQIIGNATNTTNYLIKIKDNNPATVIKALIIGAIPAISISPTKIVTTTDGINDYVYVGGSSITGGIYRIVNDSSPNTIPYIAAASTNGIFDVDETAKKLYFSNSVGTLVTIRDLSIASVPDITMTTPYINITEIKISPDGNKLLIAGRAIVTIIDTPIIDIYTKNALGTWKLTNRSTFIPNIGTNNIVTEIVINKASTFAYAVNPIGTMVSSIKLIDNFFKIDKLLTGYVPRSIVLKGTELYIADSSAPKILKLNATDLSLLKIIAPPYTPNIIPNKLALTAYDDALYVTPFKSTDIVDVTSQWRIELMDPITGIDDRKSTYNVGLYNQSPIATYTIFSQNDISPSVPLPEDRLQNLNEAVCIIGSKIFSSCKKKDFLADILTPALIGTEPYVLTNIKFENAVITNKIVTFIDDGNNLSRVEFDVTAPYTISYTANTLTKPPLLCTLNMGHKDILMYIPQTGNMNEKDYNLIAETYTDILDGPKAYNNTFVFTVGLYEIYKITQVSSLFIPAFGYCPIPTDCTPYQPSIVKVRVTGIVASWSIFVILIEVEITRAGSGNKDYYYITDEYDNLLNATPLFIDKTYNIYIFPPEKPGDTQQIILYGSYRG